MAMEQPFSFTCGALLFDLDGTLVDSTASVVRNWASFGARHGIALDRILAISHGQRTEDTIHALAPHLDALAEAERHHSAETADTAGTTAVAGALALLSSLPPDRWAIVTSCPEELAVARMRAGGIPRPRVIVTAEQVRCGKPDPEGYLAAARSLGVAPERCVVVEDAHSGVRAGKDAGMRVLGVATTFPLGALETNWSIRNFSGVRITVTQPGDLCVVSTCP
eukprot:TRINITY_DN758_c0_g2_i1.p2 TRINITY_DN758_c0_g2~~TRINITY_DN758_c0_g2_i1.p2  ORF type:complete len:223 (-),score=59.56 TRINITY_DN758_c0_g2_i1:104-772(-)